jgi:predicted dehydrogenase
MNREPVIRVGFIGAGWTERVQIPTFMKGGLRPQAIAANHSENARRVAEKFAIPEVYATWQELISSPSVDLVSIVTPPHNHKEIAIAALAAGKHVICEKPTALNVAEAESMFAAAQAAPGQLAIIDHELRFHPARLQMRQMVREGHVGAVLRIKLDRLGGERLSPTLPWTWWSDAEQGGGMLRAVGSHLLDLARWLVGRIENITGQLQTGHYFRNDADGRQRQVTADDHADILLRFANGAQGRITVSGLTPGGYGMSILIVGTKGALRLDNQDQLWGLRGTEYPRGEWEVIRPRTPVVPLEGIPTSNPFAVGSYYLAQTLATMLSMGDVALSDAASFYDGVVVQRLVDAAQESHRRGASIQL